MTKKREPCIIDSINDTDSDYADPPKTKAWKRLRKGPQIQEPIDQVFDDPFPFGFVYETPDANEIRW